jgi:hypothetical protein
MEHEQTAMNQLRIPYSELQEAGCINHRLSTKFGAKAQNSQLPLLNGLKTYITLMQM